MSGLSTGIDEDVGVAMVGGDTFEDRLKQLAAAKQSLSQAYTDLGIGKSAKVFYEEANAKQLEAEALMAKATSEYEAKLRLAEEDAKKQYEGIVATASSMAKGILEAAEAEKSKAAADLSVAAAMAADAAAQLDGAVKDIEALTAAKEAALVREVEVDELRAALHADLVKTNGVATRLKEILNEVSQLQKDTEL